MEQTPEQFDIATPKASRNTSDNSTSQAGTSSQWSRVPGPFMPMWQYEEQVNPGPDNSEKCYHGLTNLSDGRQGLLVDPGAWSNLAGESWVIKMARKAVDSGYKVAETRMVQPLNVAGVGTGSNSAEWEVQLPIAVCDSDGHANLHVYKAPTVRGEGKDLPALLGLQSMSKQNSVLEMAPGNEFLTMPGPGGYTVEWSPGAVRYKLERAPSGHLTLPCDAFAKVQANQGGVNDPVVTFYGTHASTTKKQTKEIGTQTEGNDAQVQQTHTPTKKQMKVHFQTKD
jgi:hypothetical protein